MIKTLRKAFQKKRTKTTSPIWLTVYSDLVTNLTLFFLVLYGFTRLASNKQTEMLAALARSVTKDGVAVTRAQQVLHRFQEQETISKLDELESLGEDAKLNINEQMIKITLRAPVLFGSGESQLKKEARPILNEIAGLLRKLPNNMIIEGHTDNIPITGDKYKSNWELSSARAINVINHFVNTEKLNPKKFISAGYGEYRPVAPNDTPENRALNRRIEINIIR